MTRLPFIPDHIYRRSDIHDQYGGNRQSGICPSATVPYIFIFSGSTGHQHGYKDQWENDYIFSYTGEGQVGDMKFTRGNLALQNHPTDGKRVFSFRYVQKGFVQFVSELEFHDADIFETHDRNGQTRIGIKFFFKRAGARIEKLPDQLVSPELNDSGLVLERLKPTFTERSGLVTSRVGQGAYRKSILHRWEYCCAVTRFNDTRVLIASHIVPWKRASNEQRLDVDNGILLSPTYDALFDKHLITFDNNGRILLSDQIDQKTFNRIGVDGKGKLRMLNEGTLHYLHEHQEQFHMAETSLY